MVVEYDVDIVLIEARNLFDSEFVGEPDPYCTISLGSTVCASASGKEKRKKKEGEPMQTEVEDDTLNPRWNQSFSFASAQSSAEIIIEIFNKDVVTADDFMGRCVLPLEELVAWCKESNSSFDRWITLGDDAKSGEVHISGSVRPANIPPPSAVSPPTSSPLPRSIASSMLLELKQHQYVFLSTCAQLFMRSPALSKSKQKSPQVKEHTQGKKRAQGIEDVGQHHVSPHTTITAKKRGAQVPPSSSTARDQTHSDSQKKQEAPNDATETTKQSPNSISSILIGMRKMIESGSRKGAFPLLFHVAQSYGKDIVRPFTVATTGSWATSSRLQSRMSSRIERQAAEREKRLMEISNARSAKCESLILTREEREKQATLQELESMGGLALVLRLADASEDRSVWTGLYLLRRCVEDQEEKEKAQRYNLLTSTVGAGGLGGSRSFAMSRRGSTFGGVRRGRKGKGLALLMEFATNHHVGLYYLGRAAKGPIPPTLEEEREQRRMKKKGAADEKRQLENSEISPQYYGSSIMQTRLTVEQRKGKSPKFLNPLGRGVLHPKWISRRHRRSHCGSCLGISRNDTIRSEETCVIGQQSV